MGLLTQKNFEGGVSQMALEVLFLNRRFCLGNILERSGWISRELGGKMLSILGGKCSCCITAARICVSEGLEICVNLYDAITLKKEGDRRKE